MTEKQSLAATKYEVVFGVVQEGKNYLLDAAGQAAGLDVKEIENIKRVLQKIKEATDGLEGWARNAIIRLSLENAETLADFILSEKSEIKPTTAETHISKNILPCSDMRTQVISGDDESRYSSTP